MRLPLSGRIGIAAVIVGLATGVTSGRWLATRKWVPVDIPVSLKQGHISTGQFRTNVTAAYRAYIRLDDDRFHGDCLEYQVLKTRWSLFANGQATKNWNDDEIYELDLEKGDFNLDVEILTDASCLNDRNPRLRVEVFPYDVDGSAAPYSILIVFSIVSAGAGFVLLIRSRTPPFSEMQNPSWFTTPLAHLGPKYRGVFAGAAQNGTGMPGWAYSTFRRRTFPRREIAPSSATAGFVIGMVWFVVFVAMMVLTRHSYVSHGLPFRLIRKGIVITKSDMSEEALLVRVEPYDRWYLNSQPVSPAELPRAIDERLGRSPGWVVYVDGNPDVSAGDVARAMDIIRGAHAEIVLLTPETMKAYQTTNTR